MKKSCKGQKERKEGEKDHSWKSQGSGGLVHDVAIGKKIQGANFNVNFRKILRGLKWGAILGERQLMCEPSLDCVMPCDSCCYFVLREGGAWMVSQQPISAGVWDGRMVEMTG